ncbi:MAG: putative O-glycosylation ligase, exosortase A system-associated [Motiliproteus sp.]
MDLRSLAVLGALAFFSVKAFKNPYIAVLLMTWLGYMNPHRLAGYWSVAYNMPLYAVITALTMGLTIKALSAKQVRFPSIGFIGFLLILFIIWLGITTLLAQHPEVATQGYTRFLKIQLSILLTLLLIDDEKKLKLLIWVIFGSIGYFGVKGGVFSLTSGGGHRVWGPPSTFIEGNNELALALIMILPLGYFLFQNVSNKWVKRALLGSLGLMVISILASYSRGALLALACTGFFLWLKSSKKLPVAAMVILTVLVLIPFMPEQWFDRMDTIETYEEDASAMGRINAWEMATNLAKDRLTGGGFNTWSYEMFALYAPNPTNVLDAHSIYFEVLGEHGFPGLLLFLLIFISSWFKASALTRQAKDHDELAWIGQLMPMCQVSLVAYASGGAFLGLAFFDLPYHIIAIIIICTTIVARHKKTSADSRLPGSIRH